MSFYSLKGGLPPVGRTFLVRCVLRGEIVFLGLLAGVGVRERGTSLLSMRGGVSFFSLLFFFLRKGKRWGRIARTGKEGGIFVFEGGGTVQPLVSTREAP